MPPIDVDITTGGSTVLGVAMFATTVLWKFVPARKPRVGSVETDLMLLSNEIAHVKETVAEIKQDVKSIQSKLR